MSLNNHEIANKLLEIADLLESNNDNPYRVRTYRRAAYQIEKLKKNVTELTENQYDLTKIPGIGKIIAIQIKDILLGRSINPLIPKKTNKLLLNELNAIRGLGPKRIKILDEIFQIKTINDLKKAISAGKLLELKGFGNKIISKIKSELERPQKTERFFRLHHIIPIIEHLKKYLGQSKIIQNLEIVGDYRRKVEIINQITILIKSNDPNTVLQHFLKFSYIHHVIKIKRKYAEVKLNQDLTVILKITQSRNYGAELLYETGSAIHIVELEKIAKQKKVDLHENKTLKSIKSSILKTPRLSTSSEQYETKIYNNLGLCYIPPELREGRGEIKAAKKNIIPQLIDLKDIRGDLHSHTNETDGRETLEDMVRAAVELGYEYLAITDHSQHLKITNGLDKKRLLQQIKKIDAINARLDNFTILKSIELDILEDGSLDLPNSILKELDLTVCSIHSQFRIPEVKQTDRILRAMDNPYFNILGHATGRLIRKREPYEINIAKILTAAKERNCFLELNAQPYRLDIKDLYCQMAKKMGVKLAISSDAHSRNELNYMMYGVFQARRGWIEAKDIINTRNLENLRKLIKRN